MAPWEWFLIRYVGIPITKWVLIKIGERHLRLRVFNNFLVKELNKLQKGKEIKDEKSIF